MARDAVVAVKWPPAEVPENMDTTIGKLGLANEQEDQLVAFP